jgi:hypothetical protein
MVGVAQAQADPIKPTAKVTATKSAKKFGTGPQWVQQPYLRKDGKTFVVKGSLLADMYRTKAKGSKKKDSLKIRVRVAKPSKISHKKRRDVGLIPHSLLAAEVSKTLTPKKGKVTAFSMELPKKTSRQLAKVAKVKRMAAVSVSIDHRKDADKYPKRDLVQVTPGPLATGKYGAKKLARQTRIARQTLRGVHNPRASVQGAQLAGTIGNEPWYNMIVVSNGTPFEQQINVNPNIQCMWTGAAPNANLAQSVSNVPNFGQVQLYYNYVSGESIQPGLAGATSGLNAPGTQGAMMQDLVQAGVAAGQQALNDVGDPDTYGEGGVIAAVGGVVLKFGETILGDYLRGTSSCDAVSTYPELFAVSSTVTAIQDLNDEPSNWTKLNDGTQFSNIPGAGGTQLPTQAWIEDNLNPMLGAQTAVTYYWNGGQPAPMVSNNAGSGSYIGGLASYQGGLFQFAGPNPGTPSTVSYYDSSNGPYPQTSSPIWSSTYENCMFGDNTSDKHYQCRMNNGSVNIQLGFLNNPLSNGGLWLENLSPGVSPEPIVTAVGSQEEGYSITCEIPNIPPNPPTTNGNVLEATFQVPFAPNGNTPELQGGALTSAVINGDQAQPSDAYYTINFFAQTTSGDFVYANSSVQSPGENGLYQPYLAPNASSEQVFMNNPSTAIGSVTPDDLQNLVTWGGPGSNPQSVQASDIANVGCSVTASLNLQGLDITNPASSFGNAWPMPQGSSGGWPSTVPSSSYNFSWMTPVQQLNLSYQSMPVGASLPVSQIQPPTGSSQGSG